MQAADQRGMGWTFSFIVEKIPNLDEPAIINGMDAKAGVSRGYTISSVPII